MLCLCSRTYRCYEVTYIKPNFSNKGLNKRVLEQRDYGPLEKYRRILNEKSNVISNKRGFWTNNHFVASYGQIKKDLSYFYPKWLVKRDGIHTQPLKMYGIQSCFFLYFRVLIQLYTFQSTF